MSRSQSLYNALASIAEYASHDKTWHSGFLLQTWKLNGDTLSCKGQPYAVIGGPCVSQDILALFRCVSVRYSFSTSDPAMLGMVGRCFVDQAPIICPNIQGLDKKEYHRLYEAQSCQLDQMLLLPLCLGTGPDAAMWGVLEMTGFMASFEAVASNFPRLLADHGLSTCRLDPIESVISSHLMSHIPRSSTEFGWDWGDEEDRSLNPSSANGSPSLAPGGLISEFAGKQLQAAALSLGSHVLAGSSTLVNAGSFKSLAVTDKLTEDAMKASLTTPASLAISLCNTLLLGEEVDMNTVLKVRSSLIAGAGASIYEPVNSMDESGLMGADSDVGNALRQMLTQSMGAQLCIDHLGRLGSQSSQTSDLGLARVSESSELNEFCRSLDNNSEGGGSFGLLQRAATVGRLLSVAVDVPDKGGKKLSRISSESRVNDVFSCSADRSIASYSTRNQSMDGEPVSGQASLDPSQRGHHSIEAARSITSSPKDFSFQPQNAFGPIKRDISLILMLKSPSEELTAILSRVDDWIFDSFELDRVTCGKPLSCLSFYLIKRAGLIEKLRLNEVKLSRFLQRIEDGYSNSSYHNKIHAADVLRMSHVILNRGGVLETLQLCAAPDSLVPREVQLLCCYFAAIIHDFEHPGLNNDFMIKSNSKVALVYNDSSPLENHHLAAAFSLLRQEPYSFLPSDKKLAAVLRRDVIQLVLSTDMKSHFSVLSVFSSMISRNSPSSTGHVKPEIISSWDHEAQLMALKMVLKVSDLGHLANREDIHHTWVTRLEQEMFSQGDKEKALHLPVSPLMDRTKEGVTKSQVYFFNVVAIPLFTQLSQAFPGTKEILELLLLNFNRWAEIENQVKD